MKQCQPLQASESGLATPIASPETAFIHPTTFDDLVLDRSLPPVVVKMVEPATGGYLPAASDGSMLTELQCEV